MSKSLTAKKELLATISRSLKAELKQPKLSFIRTTYLQEKIDLITALTDQKK